MLGWRRVEQRGVTMTRIGLTAGLLALFALGANAWAADQTYSFLDGSDYNALTPNERTLYISGLSDMMERMTDAVDDQGERAFLDRAHRCTANMRQAELRDYIDAYMQSGDYARYSMASNYRAALNVKCPR